MVIVTWNIINSRQGRGMVAVREEELAAQMAGVNVFRSKMVALIVSAAMAGMAGALMANYIQFLRPTMFNMLKSTDLTIMVIFGGLDPSPDPSPAPSCWSPFPRCSATSPSGAWSSMASRSSSSWSAGPRASSAAWN